MGGGARAYVSYAYVKRETGADAHDCTAGVESARQPGRHRALTIGEYIACEWLTGVYTCPIKPATQQPRTLNTAVHFLLLLMIFSLD